MVWYNLLKGVFSNTEILTNTYTRNTASIFFIIEGITGLE